MKLYITLFCLLFSLKALFSQTIENGYYVTLANDTVSAKIKVPRDLFGAVRIEALEKKIKVSDNSSQQLKTIGLNAIKGYGFYYKDKHFDFVSKELKANKPKFFERLADGKNAGCYYYYRSGYRGAKYETFIVESQAGEKQVLTNSMSKRKIRKALVKLFLGKEEIVQLIAAGTLSKRHLERSLTEMISSINNLK